ncbi:hypothetical protein C8J57DRAFT_1072298, partial [Mycena rebaudengoi]
AAITCTDFQIVPNTADIRALCQDNGGVLRSTQISLGNCMGNQDGNLGCQSGGGAGGSCVFFGLFQSGTSAFISAHCKTRSGGDKETDNFNLNNCFSNTNGRLTC